MASTQVNPTRMELTRLKKKLQTAVKGHRLLKDKRDELMREFLDLVRENMELRLKVEKALGSANRNFVLAKATMSEEMLRTAMLTPKAARDTQGVAVMNFPSRHRLVQAVPFADAHLTDAKRYRPRSLPAAGAVLRPEDAGQTAMEGQEARENV